MPLSSSDRIVEENSTAVYSAVLRKETGDVIGSTEITTFVITLYNEADGEIINNRELQNALNANNITLTNSGALTWTLQREDNAIVGTVVAPRTTERHVALFEWSWNTGARHGRHEVIIDVRQRHESPISIGTLLVSTWASSISNSYGSLTQANSFITYSIVHNNAWLAATEQQKVASMLEACRDIEAHRYLGGRKNTYQRLSFPRAVVVSDVLEAVSSVDTITQLERQQQLDVQRAQYHQALYRLSQAKTGDIHAQAMQAGIVEMTKVAGPVKEQYKYSRTGSGKKLVLEARHYLSRWLGGPSVVRA